MQKILLVRSLIQLELRPLQYKNLFSSMLLLVVSFDTKATDRIIEF